MAQVKLMPKEGEDDEALPRVRVWIEVEEDDDANIYADDGEGSQLVAYIAAEDGKLHLTQHNAVRGLLFDPQGRIHVVKR